VARRFAARILVVRSLPDLITEAACRSRPQSEAKSFSRTTDLERQLLRVSKSLRRFLSGTDLQTRSLKWKSMRRNEESGLNKYQVGESMKKCLNLEIINSLVEDRGKND